MAIQIEEKRSSTIAMDALDSKESLDIEHHVESELNKFQQKMVYIGGAINTILAIFFVVTSLYSNVPPIYLTLWFTAITICNIINTTIKSLIPT